MVRKYDTLDFTVTISVPQNAVGVAGRSAILCLERKLLAGEVTSKVAAALTGIGYGVPLGSKVDIHSVDIIWADLDADECEVCDECPCTCGDAIFPAGSWHQSG